MAAGLLLAAFARDLMAVDICAAEAAHHVGERATVCGVVASAKYAQSVGGQPTFLNLDAPYPRHIFTVLVWGEDRVAFPYPPESLDGTAVCVTGRIREYRGRPEIVIRGPEAIRRR